MEKLLQYNGVIDKAFCKSIIEKAKPKMIKAEVAGDDSDARVATNCWLYENELPGLQQLKEGIAKITSLPVENQEPGSVVRYDVGGKYDLHYDYFDPELPASADELKKGGNRVWSFLIYLNEDFEGGQTDFPAYHLSVEPAVGKGVLWRSTLDGELLESSLHAGLPITRGTKWIYITWIRESKFIHP